MQFITLDWVERGLLENGNIHCKLGRVTMKSFVKRFKDTPYEEIRREARLQRRAAAIGLSPRVIRCTHNSIVMENLNANCLADVYGENLEDIPDWIKSDIVDILYMLYMHVGIEYVDVTPYNFVEKDGFVWVVDFGHAREADYENLDGFLDDTFSAWDLQKWNHDFV